VNNVLPWKPERSDARPLVSVILFCKNAERSLARSIESVAGQTYRNLEYVVQDGASTDRTLQIIRGYADRLDIRLASEPDTGPADGFWRALKRCRGEIVATCLADEELMPDALERAVRVFEERPYLGAVTGDALNVDAEGRTLSTHRSAPFSFARYLAAEYCPYWSSSFFSMRALRLVGLFDSRWSVESLEFEIWCRLAEDCEILYLPQVLSKYAIHAEQLSNQGERALVELRSRLQIIRDRVFRADGVFGGHAVVWRERCMLLQQLNLLQHLLGWRAPAAARLQEEILANPALHDFLANERQRADGAAQQSYDDVLRTLYGGRWSRAYRHLVANTYQALIPASLRARITPQQKARLRRLLGMPRTI
jgi:hypothetical protein